MWKSCGTGSCSVRRACLDLFFIGNLKHPLLLHEAAAALCIKYADHFFHSASELRFKTYGPLLESFKRMLLWQLWKSISYIMGLSCGFAADFEQNAVHCHFRPMYTHTHSIWDRIHFVYCYCVQVDNLKTSLYSCRHVFPQVKS